MLSPQHNSVQSFKSYAGAKTAKLILDGIISIVPYPFVPMHPSHSYFWSGSSSLDWCEKRFTTNVMSQALSRFLVKFDEFFQEDGSPSLILRIILSVEIRQNPLEYTEVLIPDTRGSQHLPIWSTSACRTMSHPLWWQRQFLASVLATCIHLNTTVFNYSNHVQVQIWWSQYQYLSCYVTCQGGAF